MNEKKRIYYGLWVPEISGRVWFDTFEAAQAWRLRRGGYSIVERTERKDGEPHNLWLQGPDGEFRSYGMVFM
jgi:hypothetical protein